MRKVSHLCCLFFFFSTIWFDLHLPFFAAKSRILCPMICEKVKKQFCKLLVSTILYILLRCRRIVVAPSFSFSLPFGLCHLYFVHARLFYFHLIITFFSVGRRKAKCMLQWQTLKILALSPPTTIKQIECLRINWTRKKTLHNDICLYLYLRFEPLAFFSYGFILFLFFAVLFPNRGLTLYHLCM